jgi:Mn-dependent DtxR family transcriptional regulator
MAKTPLEKIQEDAAATLLISTTDRRRVLDAFLVQAFDLGSRAQRELSSHLDESTELEDLEEAAEILGQPADCPSCGAAHATEAARDSHIEAAH